MRRWGDRVRSSFARIWDSNYAPVQPAEASSPVTWRAAHQGIAWCAAAVLRYSTALAPLLGLEVIRGWSLPDRRRAVHRLTMRHSRRRSHKPASRGGPPRKRIRRRVQFWTVLLLAFTSVAVAVSLLLTPYRAPDSWEVLGLPVGHWITALGGGDVEGRADAAYALGLPDSLAPEACRALAEHLTDTTVVRAPVFTTLRRSIGKGQCIDELIETLTRSQSGEMRAEAADALKPVGRSLAPVLGDILPLLHDPDGAVRSRVAMLVASIGDRSDAVQDALVEATKDPEPAARSSAIEAAGGLPISSERFREVARRGVTDPDPRVRVATMKTMGARPDIVTYAVLLLRGLEDSEAEVRAAAAWSLGLSGDTSEGPRRALTRLISDPDPAVRRAASKSLSRLAHARIQ